MSILPTFTEIKYIITATMNLPTTQSKNGVNITIALFLTPTLWKIVNTIRGISGGVICSAH
uniref:Uncharacterized protein n=1 Tax=Escherichia coli TaxID=562 RepID=A0A5B9T687_ECOLX|nr:hypothetical protein [Escherichia coli]